jgi:hypothetical protein
MVVPSLSVPTMIFDSSFTALNLSHILIVIEVIIDMVLNKIDICLGISERWANQDHQ